jgi:hypothetical protein
MAVKAGDPPPIPSRAPLRVTVLGLAAAQTAFWIYTWYYLIRNANPMGDGMELVATVPLTFIFLVFVLPGFLLALNRRALIAALVLLGIGLLANAALWTQILSEIRPR